MRIQATPFRKRKKCQRRRGILPLLELAFAAYFLLAVVYAAQHARCGGTIPFLALFLLGLCIHGHNESAAIRKRWAFCSELLLSLPAYQTLAR
ncbi:MAG: hypothetical protein WKF84_24740 [Pyrinomonadaceae bacterium]